MKARQFAQIPSLAITMAIAGCLPGGLSDCPVVLDEEFQPSSIRVIPGFAMATGYSVSGRLNNAGQTLIELTNSAPAGLLRRTGITYFQPCTTSALLDTASIVEIDTGDGKFEARSMNDRGEVLGQQHVILSRPQYSVFDRRWIVNERFQQGVWRDGTLEPVDGGVALHLNNSGQIAGVVFRDDQRYLARWDRIGNEWRMTDLGVALKDGAPTAINEMGDICGTIVSSSFDRDVGHSGTTFFERLAFVWTDDTLRLLPQPDDTAGTEAVDVNDLGQVLGGAHTDGAQSDPPERGVLWDGDQVIDLIDLGDLGGRSVTPLDINNLGQIVGTAETPDRLQRAFLWEDGEMINMNDLIPEDITMSWTSATSINDDGWIWVNSRFSDGSFLLTPE